MELRTIANTISSYVNPNTYISIQSSTGYTVGAGRKQTPTYASAVTGYAQIQAIDNEMLQHIDGLNLQATYKVLYFSNQQLFAAVNTEQKGGDLITFNSQTWLIVKVLERYENSFWCKVLICLQSP